MPRAFKVGHSTFGEQHYQKEMPSFSVPTYHSTEAFRNLKHNRHKTFSYHCNQRCGEIHRRLRVRRERINCQKQQNEGVLQG